MSYLCRCMFLSKPELPSPFAKALNVSRLTGKHDDCSALTPIPVGQEVRLLDAPKCEAVRGEEPSR
jgi:hypothetical protein